MRRLCCVLAVIAGGAAAATGGVAALQAPRFEHVQKDLFAAGGAFVNAWADYDGDGDLDLFVGFDGMPNRLYRNDNGRFTDAGATAGVADARPTRAVAWGDVDADGDPDLLVGFTPGVAAGAAADAGATSRPPSILKFYRNTKGAFRDVTDDAGLHVASGAVRQPVWVDFDGDDDLDLFVAFRDKANAMFRNDNGTFVDVASSVGLADTRRTVGAVWFDSDSDGDLDLIVGNMDGDANGLFRNDDGRFTDIAAEAGVAWGGRTPGEATNGTVRPCAADVNDDGLLDLFFANYGKNGLFLNRGKGRFEDVSTGWGIAIDGRYDTCAFGDLDNDGDLDLYVNGTVTGGKNYPDSLFRNTGKVFEDISPAEIGSPAGDHGVQWADFDADGALDLALTGVQKDGMHWLLHNLLPRDQSARGVSVRVLDAQGSRTLPVAEIRVHAAGGAPGRVRVADTGSGYNSQNDAPIHVALPPGADAMMLRVTVRRGGRTQVVTTPAIDPRKYAGQVYEFRIPAEQR